MAKLHFIIFCLFISLVGFNQKTIILDSTTNAPIAFVRVSIPGSDTYLLSNSKGEIVLDSLWMKSNTLSVFCYGYVRKTISKSQTTILLSPSFKELKESKVVVSKRRYGHKKLGEEDHPTPRSLRHSFQNIITGRNGELKVVWIPNEKSLKGYLEKVNVFILAMGQPSAYFRLHFYACSKLKLEPAEEITSQNIIANGTTGNEWVTVDVSSLRIPLSENGIFVGIEWFDNEVNTSFTDTLTFKVNYVDRGRVTEKHVYKGNGCVLGSQSRPYRVAKHINWGYHNNLWYDENIGVEQLFFVSDTFFKNRTFIPTPDNCYCQIPSINIEVKYIKQKNESEFEDPKKRKLNRFEKVKEDEFLYPQNTINELFSSLNKGIEKNEFIYVLKYLCVYSEDQFEDLLKDINHLGTKLTPKEQESCLKWIKHFQAGLTEENISLVEGNEFLLNVNGEKVYLLHEKGKWKLNPYSSRIYNTNSYLE
jgi:disulfide oxidoreductase YuzD